MLHFIHTVAIITANVIVITVPFAALTASAWLIVATVRHRIRARAQRRAFLEQARPARPLHVTEATDEAFEAALAALLEREDGR